MTNFILLFCLAVFAMNTFAEIQPDDETKQLFAYRRQVFNSSEISSMRVLHSKGISVQATIYQKNEAGNSKIKLLVLVKNDLKSSLSLCMGDDFNAIEPSLKTGNGISLSLNEKGKTWRSNKNTFSQLYFTEVKPGATKCYILDLDFFFEIPSEINSDIILSGRVYFISKYPYVYSDKLPVSAVPFSAVFGPGARKDLDESFVAPVESSMEHIKSANMPEKVKQ